MSKSLWLPRHKARETQCASCPFLEGNDSKFGTIVDALRRKKSPNVKPPTKRIIDHARKAVRLDVLAGSGDFVCHATAYGPDMEVMPAKEWRQCPGATKLREEAVK